ncbi:lysozyme C, milk isozyme-like [Latimeria chalumnae]|uniref:Glycosyl hydrolases family 22 (GH22) domain-containing protein n=1 Tax=Latimeria chalumnae TaxID=7897 RepID=M3XHF1_LATCH|nr:PREDICTED: lysozyme C, milk isozyme-like [Latimeria chalumnae]|eukprot:XP_005994444.2 PREDICTED: lysozyme C, milk isozyme-like [Latimeria chalumnae]
MKALILLFGLVVPSLLKEYERCELAAILKNASMEGYEGYSIRTLVCMASIKSNLDSELVTKLNDTEDSYGCGIFQINSWKWCVKNSTAGQNLCNTDCDEFQDDDITDDIECLKLILQDEAELDNWFGNTTACKSNYGLSKWTEDCKE